MSSYAPLVGRILIGILFLIVGIEKLIDVQGTGTFIASVGLPYPIYLAALAGVFEVVCGTLLILGFKTRYAAGALALFTVTVNAIFHTDIMGAQQIIFLKDLAIAGGLLYIAAYGSERYSIDKR